MIFELWDWLNEIDDDDVKSNGFPNMGMNLRMMMTLTHPPVGSSGRQLGRNYRANSIGNAHSRGIVFGQG